MLDKISVLIIDDSATMRRLITKMLSLHPTIEVVGTAMNGRFGLDKMELLKPKLIILDLEMPQMNGIEFLKEKRNRQNNTPVIVLSAIATKGAKITMEALSLGASDFILKPSGDSENMNMVQKNLIEMILSFFQDTPAFMPAPKIDVPKINKETTSVVEDSSKNTDNIIRTFPKTGTEDPEEFLQPIPRIPAIKILVIGISTGGPNALRDILPKFPENFPIPIVIVQHMPAGFTKEFADSLNKICPLQVKEAADNDLVKPGRILIAQGGKHLKFEKKSLSTVVRIVDGEPVSDHKPSVDVMFESAAEIYGSNCLACIMTGMGRDGAENIGKIMNRGGITMGQDKKSSIVYGMPHVALKLKHLQIVRPLDRIAETAISIVTKRIVIE
ncbi:MAG: chemotaxis response regulator protein-glutamate methylesterase [Spirochaetales bacterium]|nr:chemotaxis response regulator protein-glutamate methylesterase [Spirochaetales bacterium]